MTDLKRRKPVPKKKTNPVPLHPTPAPTSEIVMKPAAPPDNRGTPDRMFELFAEADQRWPGDWVLIASYNSSHGYRIKRAIERGEIQVPGGPEVWEVKATGVTDEHGRVPTELYARRIDH